MIKELMIRKYNIPNSNASCSLSASVLKGVIKGTLCTRDVDNVIYQKIIQVVVISLFGKREIFQFRIAWLWEDFSDQSLFVT